MRGVVLFLLVLVGIFFFTLAAISAKNAKDIKKPLEKIPEFSTFTSAICEKNDEVVKCKDEVFVKCNGNVSKEIHECNGFKVEIPKALGFATFGSEWKDPRN